ncbi:MAG TPA: hypothetical protein VM238_08090, partial [Phycisphaerae bacterium]|nr:hypothetical protein [Phycisphaerae bacterium]
WEVERDDAARQRFGRQVAEKAEALKEEARKATELARQGRLGEAERLLGDIEKRAHATASAAEVLARRGGVDYSETAGLVKAPARGRVPPPVAATRPVPPGATEDNGPAEGRPESDRIAVLRPSVAAKPMLLGMPEPTVPVLRPPPRRDPAGTVRLEGTVAATPEVPLVPETPSGEHGRLTGLGTYLRYPDAKDWKALTDGRRDVAGAVSARPAAAGESRSARPDALDRDETVQRLWDNATTLRSAKKFPEAIGVLDRLVAIDPNDERAKRWRQDLAYLEAQKREVDVRSGNTRGRVTAHFFADELDGVQAALEGVSKARETLEREARRQEKVKFNVSDLAERSGNGRELAEFVTRNYSWAFTGHPSGQDVNGIVVQDGKAVNLGAIPRRMDTLTIAGGTLLSHSDFDGDALLVHADDSGSLVVENRPDAVANVETVLERLRLNLGQRVGVASRNFYVDAGTAEAAGIRWKTGANGVRYAVVNEGQLRGVMDVEQRGTGAALSGQLPPRDAYQEAVVGTDALIANGVAVSISRAEDVRNTLTYNGNALPVAHDDYLIVDNGAYLTAVKSGRMQHWSVEVEPVRFPGVPAAVVVPTVGYTVKFEKTLLDVSDRVELSADYTWQGDER